MDQPPAQRIGPGDPGWPRELDTIDAPPSALWYRGDIRLLDPRPRIALVGTRSPSPYGEAQAHRFARAFSARGIVIVSGLARGIDACAHLGALESGGTTIGVLGSGVDRPWPQGPWVEKTEREGLVLSEFPPQTPPRRHHFPLRNRLISALSQAVLVVEAAAASGSLITAGWAGEQGRAVFALPGRVDHPMARGCHRLLREGAGLIESPAQLLAELGWETSPEEKASPRPHPLCKLLEGETLTAEELALRAKRAVQDVLVDLVELKLRDQVVSAPGGLWRLPTRAP